MIDSESKKELRSITLSGKGIKTIRFEQKPYIESLGLVEYKMTEPVEYEIKRTKFESTIYGPVSSLAPDQFVADSTDDAAYGFDDPTYTIQMDYKGENLVFLVGDAAETGRYFTREGSGEVFSIGDDKIAFLDKSYMDSIGEEVYYKYIERIDEIKITDHGQTHVLKITGEADQLQAEYNGKTYNADQVNQLYSLFQAISIKGECEPTEQAPDVTFEFTFRDEGGSVTVNFADLDDQRMAAGQNGKYCFYTLTRSVNNCLERFYSIFK
jgi:hypothetical protein